jgi:hypothetical protein
VSAASAVTVRNYFKDEDYQGRKIVKAFWRDAVEKLIVNSRRLLMLAGETDSPGAIERVILTAPRSDAELTERKLTKHSYCMKCLLQAQDRLPDNFNPLLEEVGEYFIDHLPKYSRHERHELEVAIGALRGLRAEMPLHHESAALRVVV